MTMQQIANEIPHEFRQKILFDWLPGAAPNMGNDKFKLLFEAYFIYVEPDAVPKDNCQKCLNNVLNNWRGLVENLKKAELEYNTLEKL